MCQSVLHLLESVEEFCLELFFLLFQRVTLPSLLLGQHCPMKQLLQFRADGINVQRCRGLAGRNSQLASPIHLVTNSYVPNAWAMALCGFQHLIAFGTGSRMASYRVNTCPDYDPRILTRLHCKLFSVHDLTYVRNEWPHATIKGSGAWLYV